jgi:hypothetical protein
VSSLLFGFCLLLVLVGLYLWARRRATSIREQAAAREQAAMAMMLGATPSGDKPRKAELPTPSADEIDHAALIRQAHGIAAQGGDNAPGAHSLPPIDYEQSAPQVNRELTPAEQAAAGLDPIEELISQIMVDEASRPPSPRVAPPAPVVEPKRARAGSRSAPRDTSPMLDSMAPSVPLRDLVLAW